MPSSLTWFAKDTAGDKETVNKSLYSCVFCISVKNQRAEKPWSLRSDTSVLTSPPRHHSPIWPVEPFRASQASDSEAASLVRQEAERELFGFTSHARDWGGWACSFFFKETVKSIKRIKDISSLPCQITSSLDCRKDNPGTPDCCIPIRTQVYSFSLPYKKSWTKSLIQHFFKWHLYHMSCEHIQYFHLPPHSTSRRGCWEFTLGNSTECTQHFCVWVTVQGKHSDFSGGRQGHGKDTGSPLRGCAWIPSGRRIVLFFTKEMQNFFITYEASPVIPCTK